MNGKKRHERDGEELLATWGNSPLVKVIRFERVL
jgi:hypothetical protein